MKRRLVSMVWVWIMLGLVFISPASAQDEGPTMGEFMGLCVHTVLFEAESYTTVTRQVRDYHGANWDLGEDPATLPEWPLAGNGVNWDTLYGAWSTLGYDVLVSLMFTGVPPENWSDLAAQSWAYGESFATYFGPSGQGTVPTVQIGNEPTNWDDPSFRTLFENTARGVRAGDPDMRIATCAAHARESDTYSKGLADVFGGLEDLYDIITVNAYALVEGWPTWRRSFPEDPAIDFLVRLQEIIDWRDANVPNKEIWVTEFGWDSSTQEPDPESQFAQWEDVSDAQQALYIVRTWLVLSAMDLDRAYLYWFNDDDTPQFHGSSGLTRNGEPKPSFHATAHLLSRLGGMRFTRTIEQTVGETYVYAYADPTTSESEVWVAWSPTGEDRQVAFTLSLDGWTVERAEQMPMTGETVAVEVEMTNAGAQFELTEAPTYLWMRRTAMVTDGGVTPPDASVPTADMAPLDNEDGSVIDSPDGTPRPAVDAGGRTGDPIPSDTSKSDDAGCDCSTGDPSSTPIILVLVGLLSLGRSRRRERG